MEGGQKDVSSPEGTTLKKYIGAQTDCNKLLAKMAEITSLADQKAFETIKNA